MTTLISMIGTGRFVKQQVKGYEKITYSFEGGKAITTSCSTNAILASGLYAIDKVVMIGTTTSAWGELLDDPSPAEEETFFQLYDICEKKQPFDVNSPVAAVLKDLLKKRWNVQTVSFIATTAELTPETAEDIYSQYVAKCQGLERNFILDVTHGLRWMPMFLTSAIRYKEMVEHGLDSIRILYAEFKERDGGRTGVVRELDTLWKGQKIAEAMRLFIDKFDAGELVHAIPDACSRLKEAMVDFGNSMQADFLMPLVWDRNDTSAGYPLGKIVKQLRNGVAEVGGIDPRPAWLDRLANEIYDWVSQLQKRDFPSERLLFLADMYAERQWWGQALLTLDVALRIFACERSQPRHYPNWDDTRQNLEILKNDLKARKFIGMEKDDINAVYELMHTRNMVAHGTLNSVHDIAQTPVKPNLAKQYANFRKALDKLFADRNQH